MPNHVSHNRYKAATFGQLAEAAGVQDVRTFMDWLTREDWKYMIDLGWRPFERLLKPPVVKFLREKFVDPATENLQS